MGELVGGLTNTADDCLFWYSDKAKLFNTTHRAFGFTCTEPSGKSILNRPAGQRVIHSVLYSSGHIIYGQSSFSNSCSSKYVDIPTAD